MTPMGTVTPTKVLPWLSQTHGGMEAIVASVNQVQHSFLVYRFPGCCLSGLICGDAGLSNLFIFTSFGMATSQLTHRDYSLEVPWVTTYTPDSHIFIE